MHTKKTKDPVYDRVFRQHGGMCALLSCSWTCLDRLSANE